MVPAAQGTPMPDRYVAEEKARLLSVYLRPWVLEPAWATASVPYLGKLDCIPLPKPSLPQRRLRGKQSCENEANGYAKASRWYIRGHVGSLHSQRLIIQFLAACCGKSTTREAAEDEEDEGKTPQVMPANSVPLNRVHGILDAMSAQETKEDPVEKDSTELVLEDAESLDNKALKKSSQMQDATQVTAKLWPRSLIAWPQDDLDIRMSSLQTEQTEFGHGKPAQRQKQEKKPNPFVHQSRAYIHWK